MSVSIRGLNGMSLSEKARAEIVWDFILWAARAICSEF